MRLPVAGRTGLDIDDENYRAQVTHMAFFNQQKGWGMRINICVSLAAVFLATTGCKQNPAVEARDPGTPGIIIDGEVSMVKSNYILVDCFYTTRIIKLMGSVFATNGSVYQVGWCNLDGTNATRHRVGEKVSLVGYNPDLRPFTNLSGEVRFELCYHDFEAAPKSYHPIMASVYIADPKEYERGKWDAQLEAMEESAARLKELGKSLNREQNIKPEPQPVYPSNPQALRNAPGPARRVSSVQTKNGIPAQVYDEIAATALSKWPVNYNMQSYEIKMQVDAYKKLHP